MANQNENINHIQNMKNKPPEKLNDTFNLYEYKSKSKCTYFQYGDIAIEQDAFCCEICDPNKTEFICEECYNSCHKNCRNDEEEPSTIANNIKRKFFCECGLKKHEIEKQKDQELIKACLFGEIDSNMGIEIKCFCKTCKIYICYICSKECHKQKNGCELQRGKIRHNNHDKGHMENVCECKAPRHSNKTSMIRIINKFIDKEEYGDVQHIWRLQLFNNFCMSQIFSTLFFESQSIINNFTVSCVMRRDYFNLCDKFVRLGKLILKSQKYFYFKANYVHLISYKYIINVITSFKPGQYEKFGNYICSLCFFFYFIHLKRDFQNIKGLCIIDFFISNPLDRIFYRKLLHSKTIYTHQIYEKYFDENLKIFKIADICNQLLEVLDNAIIDFTIKKLDKCLKNFFTILKICFFCLKRYLFDLNNLKKFIDIYLKIALNIYHYVDNCLKEKKTGIEFSEFLETLMYYLTRINICLVFNYNDLIIEKNFESQGYKNGIDNINTVENYNIEIKEKYFNYYSHETSKKLLRLLIITSTIYGTFTMNTEKVNKEHLNQLNILLETFILTNNVYSINFKSINLKSYKLYYNRILKIESLVNLTNLMKKKKIILSRLKTNSFNEGQYIQNNLSEESLVEDGEVQLSNNKKEEYILIREIAKPEQEEDIEFCLRRNIFNLKEKIEANFEKFFQYKIKIDKVMKELIEDLKEFCIKDKSILNKATNLEFPNKNELNEEFNYNQFLRKKRIKNYQKKIKSIIQNKFTFLSYKSFNSNKTIQNLIDELILSSFDTTITKIFFMDKSNKLLSQQNCLLILNFLYIYSLTEDGLKNFCLGRNFRRIIKCFALHPKITLEFYYNIFKGIYLYNIDIKNHKKLSKIVDDLVEYLKKFDVNTVDGEILFKEQFHYVAKTLRFLSNSLDLKYLNKIKIDICEILNDKKIINNKKMGILIPLYFIFSPDGSKEKKADNNIKTISQRFKFQENPSVKKNKKGHNDDDDDKINSSRESMSEIFGAKEKNDYDYEQSKEQVELKKELLAKYLVKEKEIASKMQRLLKIEKNDKASFKKNQRKKDKESIKESNLYKDQREDEVEYLESLSNGDLRKLVIINEKFIFSFLDIISNITVYVSRKNKAVLDVLGLFDLEFLAFLLSRRYIKIKYRIIIIRFIHEIYFGDEIKNNEISNNLYPNSEEYYQLIQKKIAEENKSKSSIDEKTNKNGLLGSNNEEENIEDEEEENSDKDNKLNEFYKLNNLNILKVYMKFLINELEIMIKVLLDESDKDKIELGLPYLTELIFGIKLIGDIFISNDITSYIVLWLFELVKSFLCKSYFFKKFFENIKNHKSIEQINFSEEDLNESFYIYEGELTKKNFNIYNKELLFQKLLNEMYSFFKLTNFDVDFRINKIIATYRIRKDREFKVMCLNNVKEGTGLLAEEKDNEFPIIIENKPNEEYEKFYQKYANIINDYFKNFNFLPNIVLVNLIFTKSNDISIEYKDIFIQYILEVFYHCNEISGIHSNNLFTIINKILFQDYNTMQIALENNLNKNNINFKSRKSLENKEDFKNYDELLFYNLQKYLQERITLQLVTVKKCKLSNLFLELCCETKNIIQFFQLLGEGHNKSFQTLIVNGKNKTNYSLINNQLKNNNISVFHILSYTLKKCLELINIYSEEETDGELTYDKLILLTENIVQFIIEFFQGTGVKSYNDMYNELKISLESMQKIIKLKIPSNPENKRRNFIIVLKIILYDLISSILEEGISDLNDCHTLKDIMIIFEPVSLYDEIRTIILSLYETSNIRSTGVSLEKINGVDSLIELYKFDENFQKCLELKLSLKIFYFLKILTDVYNREEVIELFKSFEKQYKEIDIYENLMKNLKEDAQKNNSENYQKKYTNKDSINSSIQAQFLKNRTNSKGKEKEIYNESTIINQNQEKNNIIEENNQEKNKEIIADNINSGFNKNQTINHQSSTMILNKLYNKDLNSNVANLNKEAISNNKINYVIFLFLSQIMKRIQIKDIDKKMGRDFSFFVIPPLCLLLSSSTKNSFVENVDRETVSTKILSLIDETDYFIYEMFYNKLTMKSFSNIDMKLFNLEFVNIEYLNFLFILVQNILSVIHYYSKEPIENSAKRKRNIDIIIILIIHMLMICFVLFVFFKYKFKLKFKHEIMHSYSEKFIFKKTGDNLQLNNYFSEEGFLNKVGRNLTLKQIFYTGFVKAILYNRQINIYFFTFLFNILFLIIPNCIFLSIPLLLVANINPLLLGIVVSFQMRLKQLIMVLIFMYLIVYLFTWFAFYYFSELFEFSELLNVNYDIYEEEKLCSSMIQCYLTMLNYGVRSGGGIGDVLPKLSYKFSPGYFVAGFFYVVLFHIFVIWIMINLFFGIIVDTFAALREKTYKIEEDKKNTCYICQITRDGAMNKNINFEKHIKNVHNIWHYVYFIAYLHINNEKNFKSLETIVLKKIKEGDTSWLPIGEENCIAN